MTHSQYVCVLGLQLSALVMHSVVQLCCYFVVSGGVHLFYTHLGGAEADVGAGDVGDGHGTRAAKRFLSAKG